MIQIYILYHCNNQIYLHNNVIDTTNNDNIYSNYILANQTTYNHCYNDTPNIRIECNMIEQKERPAQIPPSCARATFCSVVLVILISLLIKLSNHHHRSHHYYYYHDDYYYYYY